MKEHVKYDCNIFCGNVNSSVCCRYCKFDILCMMVCTQKGYCHRLMKIVTYPITITLQDEE